MNSQIRKKMMGFRKWLISPAGRMYAVTLGVSLVTLYFVIAGHFRPPPPKGVLKCMTTGLPDLTVICSVEAFNFSNGAVDFGDMRPQKEFQNDNGSFFWRYREPGSYQVNLIVRGESGADSDSQWVEVSRSDELGKSIGVEKLSIIGRFIDKITKKKKTFSVSERLNRGWLFEHRQNYTVSFPPDKKMGISSKWLQVPKNLLAFLQISEYFYGNRACNIQICIGEFVIIHRI